MIMAQNANSTSSLSSAVVSVVELNQTTTPTLPVASSAAAAGTSSTTTTTNTNTKTVTPPPSTSTSANTLNILSNSDARWIFNLEKVENTPSRQDLITKEDELAKRQESALFISDLGSRLKVNQLCINTAIIYMHRFYMIHSLKKFHPYFVATACLFFACKVEEQPRRLKEFIDHVQLLLHNKTIEHGSEEYRRYGDEIMALESCLIQTLGFNVLINHAHTVIIKTCQMIKAPRDLAEAAYLTATNSLILTNFCVKFSSEKVACFCIYLACKWTGLRIPVSSEGMQWYEYVNDDIKEQELEDISKEYLTIYGNCSPKIKKKLGITKSDDTPNKSGQAQQQPYVKKTLNSTNPSQQQQHQQRQINDPNHVNNNQKQTKPMVATPSSSSSSTSSVPHNGFNSNSHYVSQQYQQQQRQQQHQRSSIGPVNIKPTTTTNTVNLLNSSSSTSSINSNPPTNNNNNNIPGNLNKSLNLPNKMTNNNNNNQHQTMSSSNLINKPNLINGNGTSHSNNNQTGANNKNVNLGNNSIIEDKSNNHLIKRPIKLESSVSSSITNNNNNNNHKLNNNTAQATKSSPNQQQQQQQQTGTSMKRSNEETNNGAITIAPNNKIPKYVIDQKSAS